MDVPSKYHKIDLEGTNLPARREIIESYRGCKAIIPKRGYSSLVLGILQPGNESNYLLIPLGEDLESRDIKFAHLYVEPDMFWIERGAKRKTEKDKTS